MENIIAIGDIHGCLRNLKELFGRLEANGEYDAARDTLVFLGDYIDRGRDSKGVVSYIKELQQNNPDVIALMGNHEKMCVDYFENGDSTWLCNVCEATIFSFGGLDEVKSHTDWMRLLPLFYETNGFVFTHAGINPQKPLSENTADELLWVRDRFHNLGNEYFSKKVVFGHSPTQLFFGSDTPHITVGGNIGIDTGCFFSGRLTALVIEDGSVSKYYQTGSGYKVLTYNEKEHLMLMECISGDFAGDISCLTGAHYDGEALRASGNISYFISKAQFFARAGECKSNDIDEIASYIRQKYFRIPTVICLLIAEAFLA